MTPAKAIVVLWIVALPATSCFGWGGTGHQIVALIAEDQLAPQVKAGIDELLGKGSHISDAEIADWADVVRRERQATAPWHYVDIPTSEEKFDRKRDGRDRNNVIDAINAQLKVLGDKTAPREKRVEALKFVVHLVGDLHQPLHCAERGKDKGGNTRLVFYPGRRQAVNLHAVWDTWILKDLMNGGRVADFADTLERTITPAQMKEWMKGDPEAWANESHRAAIEAAYRDVAADGPPPTLSKSYIDRARPVVAEQLKRGGVRLAAILNQALK